MIAGAYGRRQVLLYVPNADRPGYRISSASGYDYGSAVEVEKVELISPTPGLDIGIGGLIPGETARVESTGNPGSDPWTVIGSSTAADANGKAKYTVMIPPATPKGFFRFRYP